MKRIQKYSTLLSAIHSADPKTRVAILRAAPDDFIKTLIELVLNFLQGNLKTNGTTLKRLRKRRTQLRRLASHRGRKGVAQARKQILQRGGFFMLAPLIGTALAAPHIAKNVARSATNSALDTVLERVTNFIKKV